MEDRAVQLQRNLSKFIRHVDDLYNEDDPAGNGFHREFRVLRLRAIQDKEEDTYPSTIGREPHNMKKNRYKDIIAYDQTRVQLRDLGVEGSDYINANLIHDPYDNDGYIASQGPLPHTVNDFWRMMFEYRVKVDIMACKLIEGNKKKCAVYWPECIGDEELYGNINVKLINETSMKDDCTVRVMEASCGGDTQVLTQYHYTGWPDHGIPDDREVILAMVAQMRDIRHKDEEKAPILVHCSAGCGRTGTVCAVDYAWEILRGGKLTEDFSLKSIVEEMREQRQSMVQTPDQYEMAHLAVKDLFQKHLVIMEENIYINITVNEEEQQAIDSFDFVTEAVTDAAASASKDNNVYSFALAEKILQSSVLDTVNKYTSESEPLESPPPTKPFLLPHKHIKPTQGSINDQNESSQPTVKHNYVNVAGPGKSYENLDLVIVEKETQKSSTSNIPKLTAPQKKTSLPPTEEKITPPTSPVRKHVEGPTVTSPYVLENNQSKSSVSGPTFVPSASSFVPPNPPFLPSESTFTHTGVPAFSMVPAKLEGGTGPVAAVPPKMSILTPQSASQPKIQHLQPTNAAKKHVTTITIGGPMPNHNRKGIEQNNNLGATVSPSEEKKVAGPVFTAPGGDVYSVVQKEAKVSPTAKRKNENSPQSTPLIGDIYAHVSRPHSQKVQGHVLGGNGSYSEVTLGAEGINIDDNMYSFVSVAPTSPDAGDPPDIPNRGYEHPQDPPPRGPPHTESTLSHTAAVIKGVDQHKIKDLITKIKGNNPTDHQFTDTSHIKGFPQRIGQTPGGQKVEPSKWRKLFKLGSK